jgi:hypothetical protein
MSNRYHFIFRNRHAMDLGTFKSFRSALVWAKHRLTITGNTRRVSGYETHSAHAITYLTNEGELTIEQIKG